MRTRQSTRTRTSLSARGKRFVIIASRFHPVLAHSLIRGATSVLRRSGTSSSSIRLLWVPGAFELPVVAARLTRQHPRPDAIIALGALIRGDTPQYSVLARAVAHGLTQVAVTTGIPVTFGVIIADTLAQARERAGLGLRPPRPASCQSRGGRHGLRRSRLRRGAPARPPAVCNRGEEAARAALDVLRLFQTLESC